MIVLFGSNRSPLGILNGHEHKHCDLKMWAMTLIILLRSIILAPNKKNYKKTNKKIPNHARKFQSFLSYFSGMSVGSRMTMEVFIHGNSLPQKLGNQNNFYVLLIPSCSAQYQRMKIPHKSHPLLRRRGESKLQIPRYLSIFLLNFPYMLSIIDLAFN